MAETEFETPTGTFTLHRGETPLDSPLRAWSAADRVVLDDLATADLADDAKLLLVNDAWGALAVPLAARNPWVWNDSVVAFAAIDENRSRNEREPLGAHAVPAHKPCPESVDVAIVQVPKSHRLLELQLDGIATALAPGGRLIVAGMSKHLTKGVVKAIERRFAEVDVRRAVGKARLIDAASPRNARDPADAGVGTGPQQGAATQLAFRTDEGVAVHEAPGVFSSGHLDIGTALLLELLGAELREIVDTASTIADLGCGNGVIGATLGRRHPNAVVTFADASYLALEAARATASASGLHGDDTEFVVADGLPEGSFDVIVSNPPFHQDHAVDAHLTERLMSQAARRLAPGGAVVLVVQRHLHLHTRLLEWFSTVEVRSGHPSHVVLEARV